MPAVTCPICDDEIPAADRLPCGHILHKHCIVPQFARTETCTCNSPATCAICIDEISARTTTNGKPSRLPCGHVVHDGCIVPWIARRYDSCTCPLCRYELPEVVAISIVDCYLFDQDQESLRSEPWRA